MEATHERERRHHLQPRELDRELALTKRDLSALYVLYHLRLATTRQLQELFGAWFDERLTLLVRAGYILRPKAQRSWRRCEGGGSKPIVNALGNRGAKALYEQRWISDEDERDHAERNRELSSASLFIPHEIDVAEAYVAFRRACMRQEGLELVHGSELAHGQDARALEVPGRDRLLYPDLPFALASRNAAQPSLLFEETDRCTEPVVRYGSEALQSLKRKYEGYHAYGRARRHVEQFGVLRFRVLTITTGGETRVRNIAHAAYEACDGTNVNRYLATNFAAFKNADPFEAPWLNAAGETVRLTL